MAVRLIDIERALDELVRMEEGKRFQRMAVILQQRRWPELIAHEPKKDDGLDAYAPPSLSGDRTGRGVACSTTPTISKVSEDAKKAKEKFPGLKTLIFVTSGKVSRITARKWAKQILKDYELELQVVSREDILATLMLPENTSICATFLNIDLRPEPTLAELIANARQAAAEIAESWAGRLKGQPLIELRAERLEQNGAESGQVFSLCARRCGRAAGFFLRRPPDAARPRRWFSSRAALAETIPP